MHTVAHVPPSSFGLLCHRGQGVRIGDRCGHSSRRLLGALVAALWGMTAAFAVEGVPPTRVYPFEEIGSLTRGAQLTHDALGRLVVAQQGEFGVLNDVTWQKLWGENKAGINLRRIRRNPDGALLYGAFGSWGVFAPGPDGSLQPHSLVPADSPGWVRSNSFDQIYCTEFGTFYCGLGGAVFQGKAGETRYFQKTGVACIFTLRNAVVISTFDDGLVRLDPQTGEMLKVEDPSMPHDVIIWADEDIHRTALLATGTSRLILFRDGKLASPEGAPGELPGAITAVDALPDGGFAVSVLGHGILMLESDGTLRTALIGPEYGGVVALESSEPGVLWAVTDVGLLKVLYGQPYTVVGRSSGVSISWPQLVSWRGRPIIASGGVIYAPAPEGTLGIPRYKPILDPSWIGVWGVAEVGGSLLVATGAGISCAEPDGGTTLILPGFHAERLVALDAETCLAIAPESIVAIRRGPAGWFECAARASGVGYPYIAHSGPGSAWVELGLNRVAKLSIEAGRVVARVVEDFPRGEPSWVNVSVVGDLVLFCGSWTDPIILDERTLAPRDEPALRRLLAVVPRHIQRVHRDKLGALWLSHDRGLMRADWQDERWVLDVRSYAGINGPAPLVTSLPEGGVWASTGSALYRLRAPEPAVMPARTAPQLLSISNGRTSAVVHGQGGAGDYLGRFGYADNSLLLEFFAGGYASTRPLGYEFRIGDNHWRASSTGSSILLPDLMEGRYRVQVRTVDDMQAVSPSVSFRLEIEAPLYRRWFAYLLYATLGTLFVLGVHRFSVRRSRRHQLELERQVAVRTSELRAAMERLRRETQTNATLAERNRLADEIHDSLEQGFTGLALQLETTAGLPGCPSLVRSGLDAALAMVGYCRKEIRHAIQGLHSPTLGTADLRTALTLMVGQIAHSSSQASVRIEGTPHKLGTATDHHLLRIAQEALANAVKHANAKRIELVLEYADSELRLSVIDDGCGFDLESAEIRSPGRFGLPSFRNRVAKIGGTIDIISRQGQGTTIMVRVPISPEACVP